MIYLFRFILSVIGFSLVWFLFMSATAYVQDRTFTPHIKYSFPFGVICAVAYFLLHFGLGE